MKNPLFQLISSGVALGMMGGSVAIHSVHVSSADELGETQEWVAGDSDPAARPGMSLAAATSLKLGPAAGRSSRAAAPDREAATTVQALEEIVARLQELKTENESLRGQLEETNRDVMGMQFRLDSHSESFRPLPVSSESLLRNSISPGKTLHPLLPPK